MKLSFRTALAWCIVSLAFFYTAQPTFATGSFQLTTSQTRIAQNELVYVTVHANLGSDHVNAIQANLTYPTQKLKFVSMDTSKSPFDISASTSAGSGSIQIARGIAGQGITGNQYIATITFRALASTGSASVSVANDSALVRGNDQVNVLGNSPALNIHFLAAALTPTSTPIDKKTAEELTISNVTVEESTFDSVHITWKTNVPATSIVHYGPTESYVSVEHSNTETTNHSVILSTQPLTPGMSYHYQVKSITSDGQEASSSDFVFKLPGYTLQLSLKGFSPDAKVTLDKNDQAVNPKSETVIFYNVTPGNHVVIVEQSGKTAEYLVTVKDTRSSVPQTAEIQVKAASLNLFMISNIFVGIVITLIIFYLVKLKINRRRKKNASSNIVYQKQGMLAQETANSI